MDQVLVYDFATDPERVSSLQRASLSADQTIGLAPEPLIGSEEWWSAIAARRLPVFTFEGTVDSVFWGSMADWPEFRIRARDGSTTEWTREGDGRLLVEGLSVTLTYAQHPWKNPARREEEGLRAASDLTLKILVEASPRRSAATAPGPGGHGYELTRQHGGEVIHYLRFAAETDAANVAASIERDGGSAHAYRVPAGERWYVDSWERDTGDLDASIELLRTLAGERAGAYDGGEIVGRAVWGPDGMRSPVG
jgi:hypothetical protein